MKTSTLHNAISIALLVATPGASEWAAAQNATAQLALLSTTDLHYYARSYNYYSDREDKTVGFERTATLIRQARSEFPNTLLVDNGDTVQGTVLGSYEAQIAPIPATHPLRMRAPRRPAAATRRRRCAAGTAARRSCRAAPAGRVPPGWPPAPVRPAHARCTACLSVIGPTRRPDGHKKRAAGPF